MTSTGHIANAEYSGWANPTPESLLSQLTWIFNASNDWIWSVDADSFGLIVFNAGLQAYFLRSRGLHISAGMTPGELLPTEVAAEEWRALYRRALTEGSFSTEYGVSAQSTVLHLQFYPFHDAGMVVVIAKDITDEVRAREARAHMLAFERVISDLAARLGHVPADQLFAETTTALGQVCDFLGLDNGSVWEANRDRGGLLLRALYRRHDGPALPREFNSAEAFPWVQAQLEAHRTVAVESMPDLPAEASRDRATWEYLGAKSSVVFPLEGAGGTVIGAMSLAATQQEHSWPEELVDRLRLVARTFAGVLVRKRAEDLVRASEARFRLLSESAPTGIYIVQDGRFIYVNPALAAIYGAPAEELLDAGPIALIHPDDRAMVAETIRRGEAGETEHIRYSCRAVNRQGGVRHIEVLRTPIEIGGRIALLGTIVDITDRVEAEQALAEREQRYRTLIDLLPDSVVQLEADGTIIIANRQAASLRHVPGPEDMIGANIFDYIAESEHEFNIGFTATAREQGLAQNTGSYLVLRDGTRRWVESSLAQVPTVGEGEPQMILVTRDLTERRQLEQENMRLAAELTTAQRIQQMVLPRPAELTALPGLAVSASMQPATEVGGDYYDVLTKEDGTVKIGIGDVTGHGLESGVLMLMVQTAVRTLQEAGETDATHFLDVLNRTIYGNLQRMGSDKNLTLSLLDYTAGRLRLSGQHESLLLLPTGGPIEVIDTTDLGFPVGLMDDIAALVSSRELHLSPGDAVVLYSDGIPEAENEAHEQYGMERFQAVLERHRDDDVDSIRTAVLDNLLAFIGEQEVFDDITLLVMKQR